MKILYTNNEKETFALGYKIGLMAKPGTIILLCGDLGSGKTVITKGIAKGLNITANVTSPTFTIMNDYTGKYKLYHFDLFRLNTMDELIDIGYEEYFYDEDGIVVIEWADRLDFLTPSEYLGLCFESLDADRRKITLASNGRLHDELETSICMS